MNDDLRAIASDVLNKAPCAVVLAAGFGKTHLLAGVARMASDRGERVLVLTHTHAGVDALRRRMGLLGIPARDVHVTTIDSWSQRLVRSFPRLSEYEKDESKEWVRAHDATARLLKKSHVAEMLRCSYAHVLVDEYQDCTRRQHAIIVSLSGFLKTMIFGDPLQGIFDFGDNELVNWRTDLGAFRAIDVPAEPWRWKGHNEALGHFLEDSRRYLERGEAFDLRRAPVEWAEDTPDNRRRICLSKVNAQGSVVILERFDGLCEALARTLLGRFGVMEELEGRTLHTLAQAADSGDGLRAAAAVIEFARKSHAKLPPDLRRKGESMERGKFPAYKPGAALGPTLTTLEALASAPSARRVSEALDAIEQLGGTRFRKEAWADMRRAVRAWEEGSTASLTDAVRLVRDRTRILGRRPAARCVSRTVLVKGQEFDHCVVLAAHKLSAKELYVAMSRPRTSLTVLSDSPILNPSCPS